MERDSRVVQVTARAARQHGLASCNKPQRLTYGPAAHLSD